MSVLWDGYEAKPDLTKFYRREAALTHSQTLARRGLKALLIAAAFVAAFVAAVWFLRWGPH